MLDKPFWENKGDECSLLARLTNSQGILRLIAAPVVFYARVYTHIQHTRPNTNVEEALAPA